MSRPSPLAWIDGALDALAADDLLRTLRHHGSGAEPWIDVDTAEGTRRLLHLCSNGYLGLATHPEVVDAALDATRRFGTGSGSARLISGGQHPHRELELALADWKGAEDALLFSSGYLANLGVLTALVGPGDRIVSDELNHASIVDACRLARAEVAIYRHADVDHAAALLADAPAGARTVLVTDGVFSMDGDVAPLAALCDVAERYGAAVVVDDAHGSGVLGPAGRGTAAAAGCEDRVDAVVVTLSKALGSVGGAVVGSARLTAWLRNRARSFIFDTALPAGAVAAAGAAIEVVRREPERATRARRLAADLAAGLRAAGHDVPAPASCIVPVVVGGNRAALTGMERLLGHDVLAVAIRPPSVAPGTARLRATVMATHTDDDVALATRAFVDALAPVRA